MANTLHATVCLAFIAMAAIQLNDPDPTLWVLLYLCVAAIPAARIFAKKWAVFWGITMGMALACLAMSFDGFTHFIDTGNYAAIGGAMSAEQPYIEPAREFLGTLIGVACLLAYRRWHVAAQ